MTLLRISTSKASRGWGKQWDQVRKSLYQSQGTVTKRKRSKMILALASRLFHMGLCPREKNWMTWAMIKWLLLMIIKQLFKTLKMATIKETPEKSLNINWVTPMSQMISITLQIEFLAKTTVMKVVLGIKYLVAPTKMASIFVKTLMIEMVKTLI